MTEQLSAISLDEQKGSSSTVIFVIIFIVIAATFSYLVLKDDPEPVKTIETVIEESDTQIKNKEIVIEPEPELELTVEERPESVTITPDVEEIVVSLPELDLSDEYIKSTIETSSWRKELLGLIIGDDLIRRIVVFTDNFSQGELAYSHIPLVSPTGKFTVDEITTSENSETFLISETNNQRYSQYIELLHSFEPETIVEHFIEMKPLFEQAYIELGYPEKNFEQVLQQAIDRVLDFPVPTQPVQLTRPNVIYQYKQQELENLQPADKLLLRIGRENLLQLKAVALELDNQLKLKL